MAKVVKLSRFFFVFLVMAFFFLGDYSRDANAQIFHPSLPNRGGYEFGNVILHAGVGSGMDFESNIFWSNQNEKYDAITYVNPYIGVEIPMEDNRLSFEYDMTMAYFSRYTEQNHIDHRFQGLLELDLTDFDIEISDVYRRWTERAGSDELGAAGTRQRKENNRVEASVEAEFDQLEYRATYINEIDRYLSKNNPILGPITYEDHNNTRNILDLEAGYRFMPKTVFLFNLVGGLINYYSSEVPDSNYIEGLFGIKGEWFGKLEFNIRGGVKYQDYDTSLIMHDDNYLGFVARGGVDFNMTEDDVISLDLVRSNYESLFGRMNYYDSDFAGLNYAHRFNDKLRGDLFASWEVRQYPKASLIGGRRAERREYIYRTGFRLKYDVREWFSLECGYEYGKRDSKFKTFDYMDHIGSIRATVGF